MDMQVENLGGDFQEYSDSASSYLRTLTEKRMKEIAELQKADPQPELLGDVETFFTVGTTNLDLQTDPPSERNFSDELLSLIKQRGLTVATLRVATVNEYLGSYGKDSIIVENALKTKCPEYETQIFLNATPPRQIAYNPKQLFVPGSMNLGMEAQTIRMREYLEELFGENPGIVLPWLNVCETLSFAELFYRLEERPLFPDWEARTGDELTEKGNHACLGVPATEEAAKKGWLFLQYHLDTSTTPNLGALAVFQPARPVSEDPRLDYWRRELGKSG